MSNNTAKNLKHSTGSDLISELGSLALGTRLKRLSTQLYAQALEVYEVNNIALKPALFPCFYLLATEGDKSITEIASDLNVTHPAVYKMVKGLIEFDYVEEKKNRNDERKRIISLSKKGSALTKKLYPIWQKIAKAIDCLLQEEASNLLLSLTRIENAISDQSILQRFDDKKKNLEKPKVQIFTYSDALASVFYDLNAEWVTRYFVMEDHDREMLLNPKEYFISRGGEVFFALLDGEAVGTCALLPHQNSKEELSYELTKMAVTTKARGHGIGKKLCLAAIDYVKSKSADKIFLESSSKLKPALNLYRNIGFIEKKSPLISEYERADVYMEMEL